jgi:prepilin peptidase CpaA
MISSAALVLLAGMLSVACWFDARMHRIPNAVVFSGTAIALVLAAMPDGIGAGTAVAGFAVALGVTLPLYLVRVMGAGDVKLIAAVGAFLGYPSALGATLVVFVTGGVLALGWAAATTGVSALFRNLRTGLHFGLGRIVTGSLPRADDLPVTPARMPYALAIAAGTAAYIAIHGRMQGVFGF